MRAEIVTDCPVLGVIAPEAGADAVRAADFVRCYRAAIAAAGFSWAESDTAINRFAVGIVRQIGAPGWERSAWITGRHRQGVLTKVARRFGICTNDELRAVLAPLCARCLGRGPVMHGVGNCGGRS